MIRPVEQQPLYMYFESVKAETDLAVKLLRDFMKLKERADNPSDRVQQGWIGDLVLGGPLAFKAGLKTKRPYYLLEASYREQKEAITTLLEDWEETQEEI